MSGYAIPRGRGGSESSSPGRLFPRRRTGQHAVNSFRPLVGPGCANCAIAQLGGQSDKQSEAQSPFCVWLHALVHVRFRNDRHLMMWIVLTSGDDKDDTQRSDWLIWRTGSPSAKGLRSRSHQVCANRTDVVQSDLLIARADEDLCRKTVPARQRVHRYYPATVRYPFRDSSSQALPPTLGRRRTPATEKRHRTAGRISGKD